MDGLRSHGDGDQNGAGVGQIHPLLSTGPPRQTMTAVLLPRWKITSTSSDIGVTYVSVEVEVRAWSVVSTVYDARYDLQAGRLPMRLTRAALDRPRRVLHASFRASAIP